VILIRTAKVVLFSIVVMGLLASGCSKDRPEWRPMAGEGPASAETTRVVSGSGAEPDSQVETAAGTGKTSAARNVCGSLPRLVDLGRGTCIPCKMMAPILEDLKREYRGSAVVEVIDLREDNRAAADYAVRLIPTQIFFDSDGKEVWRHEGYLAKEAIVAKFAEMGVHPVDK
jgi:thioredoxin 1